ncbi:MAG: HAD family phosphatase [bacterium]|nr:HAD family phosphatase [bacterium]
MNVNKAFIFDMDGVIIDSEKAWVQYGNDFLSKLFGKKIASKIGDTIGLTSNSIYEKAAQYGFYMDKKKYYEIYDKQAAYIYSKANITNDVDKLGQKLISLGFKLGLVSSSRTNWINEVVPRIPFKNSLVCIIPINDRPDLRPKPNPDGYLEAIKKLESKPELSIILEDSNSGIQAAKESRAFVIGFTQNLVDGYKQKGADVYADNMNDVIKIVESVNQKL